MNRIGKIILSLFILGIILSLALTLVGRFRPTFTNVTKKLGSTLPQRIICAAPSMVEIVFALGAEDRVIAVSDFTTYPPEALSKTRIGGYFNPNLEQIVALQPDLVIVQGKMEKLLALCEQKRIPYLQVENDDLAMLFSAIEAIGNALGCPQNAKQLVATLKQQLNTIQERAKQYPTIPKVFLCLGRNAGSLTGFGTTGAKSFPSELLEIAGGQNIFSDLSLLYPQISKEALLMRAPDVVLEFRILSQNNPHAADKLLHDWREMPIIPAVASSRVYLVTEDFALIPGPRVLLTAQRLFDLIHADKNHEF